MATIKVKAAPGVDKFPKERDVKNYITGEPVEVESSAYYRRALKEGDLLRVNEVTPPATSGRQAPASKADTAQDKTTKKASENE
ncbi:DUF2635 domain-containing protein [Serratia sp. JSRIV004]|uniref:DUF2635 domain-containing protein n=1 Tax=Serratia sp. JSRIV004 TaxID=2831895 RepID=UPI001CBDCAD8|nr:DUF2635 domain-containing protein [Serratia sp. JSRIV004]UAN55447.1 DUF2635 domain-containing protein [Serratia sp. JSRIV004]UAN57260.1 DUF2635 domain-containing protein [Serratia sp. JSRIV004]